MARDKKAPSSGPNNGYLISFGDTMTALLAFFIVLNSLAEDQTGANLYRGTGSFVIALDSMGLPGIFNRSKSAQAVQMSEWGPLYVTPNESEDQDDQRPGGSDEDNDRRRVVDYELEAFQRFLNELGRVHEMRALPDVIGEVAFDHMTPLPARGPLLGEELKESVRQAAPVLQRPGYTVEVVVWATSPGADAWKRAASNAAQLKEELVQFLQLDGTAAAKIRSSGRPWISSTVARPSASILLRREEPLLGIEGGSGGLK